MNTTSSKKPVRGRKPTTKVTTPAAPNSNSSGASETPAIVKEIEPKIKPNSMLFAPLPEIDEVPMADLDLGYLIPSNFAPKTPTPFSVQSIAPDEIL